MTAYVAVQTAELLTLSALLTLLGRRSRQSVYDLMRRDPTFPRPIQVGSEFSKSWRRCDVMKWIHAQRPVELDGLDSVERRQRAKRAREAATC